MIRKFFKWIFKSELQKLNLQIQKTKEATLIFESYQKSLKNVLQNIDVSVDVHEYHRYSKSWAVISLQGSKTNYLKFIDLGDAEIRHIQQFLRQFENNINIKIDASPNTSKFLKIDNNLCVGN
jgi:hypothetical protein